MRNQFLSCYKPDGMGVSDAENLFAPGVLAQEISDDLEAALEQFSTIAYDDLKK